MHRLAIRPSISTPISTDRFAGFPYARAEVGIGDALIPQIDVECLGHAQRRHHSGVNVNTTLVRDFIGPGRHPPRMGRPTKSSPDRPAWAKNIEVGRLLTKMEPADFAAAIGYHGPRRAERYLKHERGKTQPNVETWKNISEVTGLSLDFLIADKPNKPRDLLQSAS